MKYTIQPRAHERRTLPAGRMLGYAPDRPTKELIARGLAEFGIPAVFVLVNPWADNGEFRIKTAQQEEITRVHEARWFVQGIVFALFPPDPLAPDFQQDQATALGAATLGGRVRMAWQFGCRRPGCVVTATARQADYERACAAVEYHGWAAPNGDWLCPTHAAAPAPVERG